MAMTHYDGEDREILNIEYWSHHPKEGAVWMVRYKRGEFIGQIVFPATDELDAFSKFPAALERLSKNYEDDNNVN